MSGKLDPFRAGPDVGAYIRTAELEQSREYLAAKLVEAPTWVGISGPAGVGKTLLARLLLRRLAQSFSVVHVPSCELAVAEIERWIGAQLGEAAGTFRELAARLACEQRPLLVALDEAQRAPPDLVPWVASWCSAECGGRAVLIWTESEEARAPAALSRCPARVLVEPLGLAEVGVYVEAQLARAGASAEERAALSGRTIERIALASGGNPRVIQRLADAELAARAWRSRAGSRRAQRAAAGSERTTESAPRGPETRSAPAVSRRRSPSALRLAALAALGLAALAFILLR